MKNLLLAFILFATTGLIAQEASTEVSTYNVGDKVENFELKNIDQTMMSLDSFEGAEGYILIFSCNHCPYSVAYEDRIIALAETYNDQNIPVIMINPNDAETYPDDSFDGMVQRAAEKKFNFPYLHDESQEIARMFGAEKTPHVYLLNKEREIKYIGAIDDSPRKPDEVEEKYLENAVEAVKRGLNPNPFRTKAIGCSIKWKS